MGIGGILNIGKKSLMANQMGLSTTSHNIANVNTEGYSRQRIELHTDEPQPGTGGLRVGTGVSIGNISRAHNDYLVRRNERESTALGTFKGLDEGYIQLDDLFKSDAESGISKNVANFFNEARSLSTQPESIAMRSAMRESGKTLASAFKSMDNNLESVQQDMDGRITGAVSDVNHLCDTVYKLNQKIMEVEMTGVSANDERDARDLALGKLSNIMEIQVVPKENGWLDVNADHLGTLVSSAGTRNFAVSTRFDETGRATKGMAILDYQGRPDKDVTDYIAGGTLKGYFNMRDTVVTGLRDKIDYLAYRLTNEVNSVHQDSFGRDGVKGREFFKNLGDNYVGAAAAFDVSANVKEDLGTIAAAAGPNAPGDNRALLRLTDLQTKNIFDGGKANFTEYTTNLVGTLGLDVQANRTSFETQNGLCDQLKNYREQLSGVSLDEEAINMVKFQKAFDASAKMIQVADQMYDTVLSLKRV